MKDVRKVRFKIKEDDFPKLIKPVIPEDSIVWTWIKSEKIPQRKNDEKSKLEVIDLFANKSQIIIYGPPGTGKTYNSIKMAIELIEGGFYQ